MERGLWWPGGGSEVPRRTGTPCRPMQAARRRVGCGLGPHARHTFLCVSAAFLKLQSPGSVRFGVPCGSAGRGARHAEGAQHCTVNFRRSRVWRGGSPPRPLNSVPLPRLFSLLLRSPEKAESVRIVGDPVGPGSVGSVGRTPSRPAAWRRPAALAPWGRTPPCSSRLGAPRPSPLARTRTPLPEKLRHLLPKSLHCVSG